MKLYCIISTEQEKEKKKKRGLSDRIVITSHFVH